MVCKDAVQRVKSGCLWGDGIVKFNFLLFSKKKTIFSTNTKELNRNSISI